MVEFSCVAQALSMSPAAGRTAWAVVHGPRGRGWLLSGLRAVLDARRAAHERTVEGRWPHRLGAPRPLASRRRTAPTRPGADVIHQVEDRRELGVAKKTY